MSGLSYKDAGVDLEIGTKAKESIKESIRSTHSRNVLKGVGLFSGFYTLEKSKYEQPVLVSSIDGVGTKVKIAQMMGAYGSIGEDLVNHSLNDIMVSGADPLFFVDYIAADKLNVEVIKDIVSGIATACKRAGCALIGGETAEMPGVYAKNNFDVAGSIVGVVDREQIIDGSKIQTGDVLIGVASNGIHTNGYSLVRKIFFEEHNYTVGQKFDDLQGSLGEELLRVHRSYHSSIRAIRELESLHGIAHITGGGIIGNTARLLRDELDLKIDWDAWEAPPIFRLMQKEGRVQDAEMRAVFNMGVGLVFGGNVSGADKILEKCKSVGEKAFVMGSIISK